MLRFAVPSGEEGGRLGQLAGNRVPVPCPVCGRGPASSRWEMASLSVFGTLGDGEIPQARQLSGRQRKVPFVPSQHVRGRDAPPAS